MDNALSVLDGYKTYIVSFVALLLGAAKAFLGWEFPGIEIGDPWTVIQVALTGMFIRRGMKSGE